MQYHVLINKKHNAYNETIIISLLLLFKDHHHCQNVKNYKLQETIFYILLHLHANRIIAIKQLKQFIYITLTWDKNHAQSRSKLKENHLSSAWEKILPWNKEEERIKKKKIQKKIINENDRYDNRHDSFPMRQPEETITTLISFSIHTYI